MPHLFTSHIPLSPAFRRTLAVVACSIAIATAAWAAIQCRLDVPPRAEIDVELFAPFLEPGPLRPPQHPVAMTDVEAPPASQAAGIYLWHAGSAVRFAVDAAGTLGAIDIQPRSNDPKSDVWNVWRHRHGYTFLTGAGYFWNTLGDVPLSMDPALGARYDAFLKRVWGYWTVRALEGSVALAPAYRPPSREPHLIRLRLPLTDEGLYRPVRTGFQINPWGVPVKIGFDVHTSTRGAAQGRMATVDGVAHWTYDRHAWRGRHGYERTLFGGYRWRDGFPADAPLSAEDGLALDALLDRAVSFWVEATVELFLADLNHKINAWIEASRNPEPRLIGRDPGV